MPAASSSTTLSHRCPPAARRQHGNTQIADGKPAGDTERCAEIQQRFYRQYLELWMNLARKRGRRATGSARRHARKRRPPLPRAGMAATALLRLPEAGLSAQFALAGRNRRSRASRCAHQEQAALFHAPADRCRRAREFRADQPRGDQARRRNQRRKPAARARAAERRPRRRAASR